MNKYIDIGIIKSITLFYKDESKKEKILSYLGKKINLNYFKIKNIDNCMIFDIDKSFINDNIISFFKEIKDKKLYRFNSIEDNIEFLEEQNNFFDVGEIYDDIFHDIFSFDNYNNLINDLYNIEIEYYSFYFDGPYNGKLYDTIELLENLFKSSLNNPIKDVLCFGISIEEK